MTERFYHEIRYHVKPQIPTISSHRITLDPIGNEQILRSDLTSSECMNLVGNSWIRSADIDGKHWILSESGKQLPTESDYPYDNGFETRPTGSDVPTWTWVILKN